MVGVFAATFSGFCAARLAIERRPDAASAVHLFKMAWFIAITLVEWRVLREAMWLPTCLGGKTNEAFWVDGDEEELQFFYEVQLAYHLHSLLFSLVAGAKPEMHLHHVVTVLLIALSDVLGYRRVGFIVFFLHDVPDITSGAIKATLQAKRIPLLLVSYVIHLFSWAYFRLNLFAQVNGCVSVTANVATFFTSGDPHPCLPPTILADLLGLDGCSRARFRDQNDVCRAAFGAPGTALLLVLAVSAVGMEIPHTRAAA